MPVTAKSLDLECPFCKFKNNFADVRGATHLNCKVCERVIDLSKVAGLVGDIKARTVHVAGTIKGDFNMDDM